MPRLDATQSRLTPLGRLGLAGLAASGVLAATGGSGSLLAVAPLSAAAALLGWTALARGRILDPAATARAPSLPLSGDAWISLSRLGGGLAMVGPEELRHQAIGRMLDHATSSGLDFVVLSLGARPDLCDMAHDAAVRHGNVDGLTLVDASAPDGFSHALDAFASADADTLVRLVSASCPGLSPTTTDAARSRRLLAALLHCLVDLRDARCVDITPDLIVNHLPLLKLIDLGDRDAYPWMGQRSRTRVQGYLLALPGYQEAKKYKQAQLTIDAHSQAESLISEGMGWLSGAMGAHLTTAYGDVTLATACEPGRRFVLHAPLGPREAGPAGFLVRCLEEACRHRTSDRPLLVVADGFDARLDDLADGVLGLRKPGLLLVTGVTDVSGKGGRLLEWAPTRLLLPGCAVDAPDTEGSRALRNGRAVVVTPGRSRALGPTGSLSPRRRGKVKARVGFPRPTAAQVDDQSRTIAATLLERLLASAATGTRPTLDPAILAAAAAFEEAERSTDAPNGGIAGGVAAILALSPSPAAKPVPHAKG